MSVLYSLTNLVQRFGPREVLNLDSLSLEEGEIYALLGANGAGKSTLMRILAFLDAPYSGRLVYKGQEVRPGQQARFRPGVVWVPQFPVLFTGTLLYNVEYPMALKNVARKERRAKAQELLEQVRLTHLAKAPAHKLSGGEAQRASIARALAAGAETILFDEPTANVDQKSLAGFITLVRDIRRQRRLTVLMATHNAHLAAALCRRQIFLSQGRLVHQYMVPGGMAWPARLEAAGSAMLISLPRPAAAGVAENCTARLTGLASLAAGVNLRLEVAPGHEVELLLEDADSCALAQGLTLGCVLAMQVEDQKKPV